MATVSPRWIPRLDSADASLVTRLYVSAHVCESDGGAEEPTRPFQSSYTMAVCDGKTDAVRSKKVRGERAWKFAGRRSRNDDKARDERRRAMAPAMRSADRSRSCIGIRSVHTSTVQLTSRTAQRFALLPSRRPRVRASRSEGVRCCGSTAAAYPEVGTRWSVGCSTTGSSRSSLRHLESLALLSEKIVHAAVAW